MRTRSSLILALLLAPAACAGPVETRINAAGAGVAQGQPLMWAPLPVGTGEEAAQARAALGTALGTQGYRLIDDAPLMLTFGLSERPAHIGLATGQDAALSPHKRRRLLQSCADRMLRLSISIIDRASGETRYLGSAEEAHCRAGLGDALPRLSRMAVAEMARPSGEQVRFSAARD